MNDRVYLFIVVLAQLLIWSLQQIRNYIHDSLRITQMQNHYLLLFSA